MKQLLQPADKREHRLYTRLRDGADKDSLERRDFFRKLWEQYEPYAPKGFPKKLQIEFHQRWWEMYLAVGMLRLGFRPTCSKSDQGPDIDLSIAERRIFMEATAPKAGDATDKVPELRHNVGGAAVVVPIPERECLLRFTQALTDKRKKLQGYVDAGDVPAESSLVIALSASELNLSGGLLEAFSPAPLKVLAGAGELVIGDQSPFFCRRETIARDSGSPVDACLFENQEFKIIPAVLYSSANLWNAPPEPERTFSLFLNNAAHKPLPMSFTQKFRCWARAGSNVSNQGWREIQPASLPVSSGSEKGGEVS